MNSHLLIRADVGPTVGTGHVMRTAALGFAFSKMGGKVTMACTKNLPNLLRHRLERQGIAVHSLEAKSKMDDAILTRQLAENLMADWILVDGYEFDDQFQQVLKLSLANLMVIDDFQHGTHRYADLILNQNIYSDGSEYSSSEPCELFCGSKFALLRSEFENVKSTPNAPKLAKRVLLTFGGADEHNITTTALNALRDVTDSTKLAVDVIVGACNAHYPEIKKLTRDLPFTVRIHRNVDRMSALMTQCDLAISAGGSTCYELARCAVPSIIISTAENQRAVAEGFHEQEAMRWVGDAHSLTTERLTHEIDQLIHAPELRREMARRASSLVDGLGAARIARRLISDQFIFREAQDTDSELIRNWRNEPSTRSASFNSASVSVSEHHNWFQEKLSSNLTDIWVVELDDQPIGQVRFDFEPTNDEATISISLAPECRGKRWSTPIIETACRKVFLSDDVETINALIKPENTASIKAFTQAGFIDQSQIALHGNTAKRFIMTRASVSPEQTVQKSWRRTA